MKVAGKSGLRWFWDTLDPIGKFVMLGTPTGIAVSGVVFDSPLWLIVGAMTLVFVVLLQGAYHAWDVADRAREQAETSLAATTGSKALVAWLREREEELRGLKRDLEAQVAQSIPDWQWAQTIYQLYLEANQDILRRLVNSAPQWADYYRQNPDWIAPGVTPVSSEDWDKIARLVEYTADQVAHIRERLSH